MLLDPATCSYCFARAPCSYSLLILLVPMTCSFSRIYRLFLLLVPTSCSYCLILICSYQLLLLFVPTYCSYCLFYCCSNCFYFSIIFFYSFPLKSMPSNPFFKFTFPLWLQVRPSQRPTPKWWQPLLQPPTVLQKANRNFPHFGVSNFFYRK
jgi:hypothetical protein